jgi:hypothetical protein
MRAAVLAFALVACGPPDSEPQPPTHPLVLSPQAPTPPRAFVHARLPHYEASVRQSASLTPRGDGKTAKLVAQE